MRGGLLDWIVGLAGAFALAVGAAAGAAAEQGNPRVIVYQLIDQLHQRGFLQIQQQILWQTKSTAR